MNETAERFAQRAARFGAILDAAGGQWDASTPCIEWTVSGVVEHVITTERAFLQERGLDQRGDSSESGGQDTDLALRWRRHVADVTAVLSRKGVAQTEYDGYFGRTTVASTMADFYGWDLVVHGWDVARATGQEWSISDEEVQALGTTADGWGDALYSEGVCGSAVDVAPDASAQDQLLARLGRDPDWSPMASVAGQR